MLTPELLQTFMEMEKQTHELLELAAWLEANAPESPLSIECGELTEMLMPITRSVDSKRMRPETAMRLMKFLLDMVRENMQAARGAVQGAQVQ